MQLNSFNIRVYGICLKNRSVLTLFEEYVGEKLIKFPGGGLEFGESLIDCLHREFDEELNLKIQNIRHFYTQEDFIVSRFRENEQLLTVYYLADIVDESQLILKDKSIEKAEWISIENKNPFGLPIDKIVFEKLKKEF